MRRLQAGWPTKRSGINGYWNNIHCTLDGRVIVSGAEELLNGDGGIKVDGDGGIKVDGIRNTIEHPL